MTDGTAQKQFLRILSREDAVAAFTAALKPAPLGIETVPLAALAGRVLARDVRAAVDAPPFDRSVVDGFAVRSSDLALASAGQPVDLRLTGEIIACGVNPAVTIREGQASVIATGGPLPRGADAVVMIEHTDRIGGSIRVSRAVGPGQNVSFAGSDIARGQTLLYAGTVIGSREIGMLAAVGHASAEVWLKPRVAVMSTGDELVHPGEALAPARVYDCNGPMVAAAVAENGCEPVALGAFRDEEGTLEHAIRAAHTAHDVVILSGGTSKGAGDLTWRIIFRLGEPGIIAHGVALKPGKPLCLAVADGKPVVVLPGFPTSAMFTFHDIVAPVLRALAGLPARRDTVVRARLAQRIPSELGRTEFAMVALSKSRDELVAHPIGKGSGAVTAFAQADGFLAIDALADAAPAGELAEVALFSGDVRPPDLVIIGSHCAGLDAVVGELTRRDITARVLAAGSMGGLSALRRGACDLAPMHLLDPATERWNHPFLSEGMDLIEGWRRLQGVVLRADDDRFAAESSAEEAVRRALAHPDLLMVNRNSGAGTRTLIDRLLAGARPAGYWNQPRSHNAVAAAVAQGRADWGVAIRPVAEALGLRFLPLAEEHYDFAVAANPRNPDRIMAFRAALAASGDALRAIGFTPA